MSADSRVGALTFREFWSWTGPILTWNFGVVTVAKGSTKRVLRLEADVKQYLLAIKDVNSQGLHFG